MIPSAGKPYNPPMRKAGYWLRLPSAIAIRGKTIQPETPENILRVPSSGKPVTGAKRGKTYHRLVVLSLLVIGSNDRFQKSMFLMIG